MKTEILLKEAYADALDTIEPKSGNWTLSGFSGSEVNAGKVELRCGRMALVKITIEADENEIEDSCDDFDSLHELEYLSNQ